MRRRCSAPVSRRKTEFLPTAYCSMELPVTISTFVLVFFRVAGLMLSAPLFGSAKIPRRIKVLLAIVLAYGLSESIKPVEMPQSVWLLAVAIGGELAFGLAMGMALSFTFVAVNW